MTTVTENINNPFFGGKTILHKIVTLIAHILLRSSKSHVVNNE